MHTALLIDEILQVILEACSVWTEREYRSSLCQIARCCKAWSDPALNRLWVRLDRLTPLVQLLPQAAPSGSSGMRGLKRRLVHAASKHSRRWTALVVWSAAPYHKLRLSSTLHALLKVAARCEILLQCVADVLNIPQGTAGHDEIHDSALARFRAYAHRVRSIRHTEAVRIPSTVRGSVSLPRLASIRFRGGGCQTADFWGISCSVREVDIHLGFSRRRVCPTDALTRYLEGLHDASPDVEILRLRGTTSAQLLRSVSAYTSLRTLDLRVGASLSMEIFCSIATTFAALRKLTVDARHLDAQELVEALASPTIETEIFRSLRDLTLQAKPDLASALLQLIPCCALETFHFDAQCTEDAPASPLRLVFAHLPESLRALSLECFDDVDLVDRATLRPLARLAGLRRCAIQVAVTPCLNDEDARDLAAWWPNLEHLALGAIEDVCGLPRDYGMTPAAYALFARSCPALRSLALPVHIPVSADELPDAALPLARTPGNAKGRRCTAVSRHSLQRLDIGTRKAIPASMPYFCDYVRALFPSLTSLEVSGLPDIDLLQHTVSPKLQPDLDAYYAHLLSDHGFIDS